LGSIFSHCGCSSRFKQQLAVAVYSLSNAFDSVRCFNKSHMLLTVLLPLASSSNSKTYLNMTTAVVSIEHSVSKELVCGTIEAHLYLRLDDQLDNHSEVFSFSARELKMCI